MVRPPFYPMSENTIKTPRFLATALETSSEDPFRDDAFERKRLAENLTQLAASFSDQPFVLGINGDWGSGKTKFLEMWSNHLRQQGFRTLHFNAWENDHSDDPFAAILSEFRKLTEAEETKTKSTVVRHWDKLAKSGLPILERAAVGAIKNLTLGILDLKSADTEALISGLAEESAKHALERCESNRKSIETFRKELQDYVQAGGDSSKPVVYMVDELDRCRPPFALAVLERIKHLLNVPGIVFVFAWDRQQLNSTIRTVYGPQTDAGGYLLRFVDLEFNLPKGSYEAYCKALMGRFGLKDYLHSVDCYDTERVIFEQFPIYAKKFQLTLREQEKAFTALAISCRINLIDEGIVTEMMLLLILLRLKYPEMYQSVRYINDFDNLTQKELPSILGWDFWGERRGALFEGFLLYELNHKEREVRVEKISAALNSNPTRSQSRDSIIFKGYCYAQDVRNDRRGLVSLLISQMEFTDAFWS